MDFEIQNIFPTPIVTTSIGREFSKEEIAFFDQCLETRISNLGNTYSENSYVLDSLKLAGEPLVETLEDAVNVLKKSELKYLYLPEDKKLIISQKY